MLSLSLTVVGEIYFDFIGRKNIPIPEMRWSLIKAPLGGNIRRVKIQMRADFA